MEQRHAVAYVSTAVDHLEDAQIEALLRSARAFNESVGVTGALLQLEHARWKGVAAVRQAQDRRKHSEGLDLLLMCWQGAPRAT